MLIPSSVPAFQSSITTGMPIHTPTWAFEGLIGEGSPAGSSLSEGSSNLFNPPPSVASGSWAYPTATTAAPPSAFQLMAPAEPSASLPSSYESFSDDASVSAASDPSTSFPHSNASVATSEDPAVASRLAAIEAARLASLNKPAGRKSSHHGKKTPGEKKAAQKTVSANKGKGKQTSSVTKAPKVKATPAEKTGTMECKDCGKTFSRPYNLKIHQAVHGGQKKRTPPSLLSLHQNSIADIASPRTDSCPLDGCNKAFSRRHDLTRHLDAYHEPWLLALGCTAKDASEDDFDAAMYLP